MVTLFDLRLTRLPSYSLMQAMSPLVWFSASLDGLAATDMFTFDDLGQSSTFHELKAIYDVLLSFAGQLTHQRVKVFTDNQRASRIVSIGSSKVRL